MKYFLHELRKRLFVHWQTTVIAVIIFTALGLLIADRIKPNDLGAVLAFMTGVWAILSKDANKVDTKIKHQIPDVGTEDTRHEEKQEE